MIMKMDRIKEARIQDVAHLLKEKKKLQKIDKDTQILKK
jgi:hypothetical protein